MVRIILILLLIVLIGLMPYFMGKWCRYNTELLTSHYMEKEIKLPNFPFVLGAYLTQCGLPYGIITDIWARCIGVK